MASNKLLSCSSPEGQGIVKKVYELLDLLERLQVLQGCDWTEIARNMIEARGRDCDVTKKACLALAIEDVPKYREILLKLNEILDEIPTKKEFFDAQE